ncbi:MAG: serine protease [Ilumatobacteraceae bacterium]|nr:serine protease [Ilumatobacteraceae bacterium]
MDPPLPPDDRLWRHPSELGGPMASPAAWPAPTAPTGARGSRAVGALAAAGLAGALVATGAMWFTRPTRVVVEEARPSAAKTTAAVFTPAVPSESLAKELAPSLVRVEASVDGGWRSATGIRIDDRGTIAVATPVVDGTTAVMVTGHDGERLKANLGGADPATGITVLTIASSGGSAVATETVDATAGKAVAVIGAASVSSASVRAVDVRTSVDPIVLHDAVQLDRAVPADVAGGIVVDADGALVGIVLAGSGPQDLAVVVPAADAIAAARKLRDDGEIRRAWLGVRAIDLSPDAAVLMDVDGGAQLTMVQAGSPASAAGLRKGDVVTAVEDRPISDASDLVVQLRHWHPGEHIVVHWHRGLETGQTEVTLGG